MKRLEAGVLAFALVLALLAAACGATAQDYPNRPIRFIVTASAGAAPDLVIRAMANKLTERLGWATVVENQVGGNFIIGTYAVARAAPDGYTVAVPISSLTVLPFSHKNLPFDLLKDFAPITQIGNFHNILFGTAGLPGGSISGLVAYSKANPGKLSYATPGAGTFAHLVGELLKLRTGLDMQNVPYKSTPGILPDAISGRVQLAITNVGPTVELIKSGKLRGIAVLGKTRSPVLPDVPTAIESGVADFDADGWLGLMAPAGTPRPIIDRLQKEVVATLQFPDMKDVLLKQGVVLVAESPEQFRRKIEADLKQWERVVRQAKISFE